MDKIVEKTGFSSFGKANGIGKGKIAPFFCYLLISLYGGTHGVTGIIVENGRSNLSSNPR